MPAEMKRWLYFAALMAGLAVWAATYAGPPKWAAPAKDADDGAPNTPHPPEDTPTAEAPSPPAEADASDRPPDGLGPQDGVPPDDAPSPDMPGLSVAQARRRKEIVDAARKREADNDARWARYAVAWERERRDPSWAEAQEKHIRQLLVDNQADQLLMGVDCRSTMCRLEVDVFDSHAAITLAKTPGLMDALGGEEAATHSPGGQTFIVLSPPGDR